MSGTVAGPGHLVVVGGGISGLAAAWEWLGHPGHTATVVEAGGRPGGKLRTSPFAGRPVDEGADTFLRRVPEALALCAEIGLDDLRSPADAGARLWIDGTLRRLPAGTVLGVPVGDEAFASDGPLGPAARRRVASEAGRTGAPLVGDVALGPYLRDHLGDEVVEVLVEPLLGGIYAGCVDDMSLDATAPQLAAAAHRDASLVRALRAQPAGGGDGPVFAAPRGGMGVLVDRLVAAIAGRGGAVRTGVEVLGLEGLVDSVTVHTSVGAVDGDAAVLAVPPAVAAGLLSPHAPEAARTVGAVTTAPVVVATVAAPLDSFGVPLDATGFLVPRTDPDLRITAASWATTKWPDLDRDDGLAVLRVSLGHARDPGVVELDDEELTGIVRRDLEVTMGLGAEPAEVRITRWTDGFPQYAVGHLGRMERVEADLAHRTPRLGLAGALVRGVGIPACIRQGRAAAAALRHRRSDPTP